MSGQTLLTVIHTGFSLIALAAGFACLFLDREISPFTTTGKIYIWTTVIVCLTGFGMFPYGELDARHALALLTLTVLGLAWLAGTGLTFGRLAPYVEMLSYSLTYFFHLIPGLAETFTRVPFGTPYFSSPEDPALQWTIGLLFFAFLIGAAMQVRSLRAELRA